MGVVHSACIGLGKDNIVWLWHVTPWGLGVDGVYHGLKWSLRVLRVLVSRASGIPDFAKSPGYHPDLSFFQAYGWCFPLTLGYSAYIGECFWRLGLCSHVA